MRGLLVPIVITLLALGFYIGLAFIVPDLKTGLAAPVLVIVLIGLLSTMTMAFLTRSLGRKAEVITTKSLLSFRRGLWLSPCSCGGM
jgi:hypothetical protein